MWQLLDMPPTRDKRWSKPKNISVRCTIPNFRSMKLSKKPVGRRLAIGKSWMSQAKTSTRHVYNIKKAQRKYGVAPR